MDNERLLNEINNYFDKIYLLTIKRNIKRQDILKEKLKGLNYEVFLGVDGRELQEEEIARLYDDEKATVNCKRSMTIGEIGCSLSHVKIYKDILAKGYDKVLILEDDVTLAEEKLEQLVNIFKDLPEKWEIFYLGFILHSTKMSLPTFFKMLFIYPILNLFRIKRYNFKGIIRQHHNNHSEHLRAGGCYEQTHAYAVRASAARKILEAQTPVVDTADGILIKMCKEGKFRTFSTRSEIFKQNEELVSSIWNAG